MQVLIASVDLGCSDEILTILAMLSAQNIFHRYADALLPALRTLFLGCATHISSADLDEPSAGKVCGYECGQRPKGPRFLACCTCQVGVVQQVCS